MFDHLRTEARNLMSSSSGQRFRDRNRRRQGTSIVGRIATIVFGWLLLVTGIAMLVLPGPGIVVAVLGLGLLAGEAFIVARALDATEGTLYELFSPVYQRWRTMRFRGIVAFIAFWIGFIFTTLVTLEVSQLLGLDLPSWAHTYFGWLPGI